MPEESGKTAIQTMNDEALALLRKGMRPSEVGRRTGLGTSLVRQLGAEAGIDLPKPGRPPAAKPPPGAPGEASAPIQAGPGRPLAEHVAAHPPGPLFGEPSGGGEPAPPPAAPPSPPLDGETLLACCQVVKASVIEYGAMAYGLQLDEKAVDRLSGFSPSETKTLNLLAPHAAKYTAGWERYAGPVMAIVFVATLGASTARSLREVQAMRPKKEAMEVPRDRLGRRIPVKKNTPEPRAPEKQGNAQ